MNTESVSDLEHSHVFHTSSQAAERSTRWVFWITLVAMVGEIAAGWWYNSMALLADGWHMSSHAIAIGLSVLAYATSRRYANDPRFAFGTWKVEILGGFASAVSLLAVATLMVVGSVEALISPEPIQYKEAVLVAILGLAVNLVCAAILGHTHEHGPGHDHAHGHDHSKGHDHSNGHDHEHSHDHAEESLVAQEVGDSAKPVAAWKKDLNLKSAYIHVLTDALTSVLAILALLGGWFLGWAWLDPVMGLVGAVWVAVWAKGLIKETGKVLLDREMDHPVVDNIRAAVESSGPEGITRVTDLHVWRVGKDVYTSALTVVSSDPTMTPGKMRERLAGEKAVVHSTIEVHYRP